VTDQIQIKDLLLRTLIGINDVERNNRQDVLVNIVLHTDTRAMLGMFKKKHVTRNEFLEHISLGHITF